MQVVECNGTIVDTSQMAGVIRRLEESFNHPLQWLVCLLHANELLLRHLFETLDGALPAYKGFLGRLKNGLRHAPSNRFPPLKQ